MQMPHRLVLDRASEYVSEATAYLRRRRETRRPFARVYWRGGRGAAYDSDSEAGRGLFVAAAELIELARGEARRG
jgi:hypothetical protein